MSAAEATVAAPDISDGRRACAASLRTDLLSAVGRGCRFYMKAVGASASWPKWSRTASSGRCRSPVPF